MISDEEINKAGKVLSDEGHTEQNRSRSSEECMGDDVYLYPSNDMIEVHLFAKSRVCWTFPNPPIGPPNPDDKFYVLTSQVQRLEDTLAVRDYPSQESHPVRMPRPERFLEALVLLRVRDLVLSESFDPWGSQLKMIAKCLFREFSCDGLFTFFADYLVRYKARTEGEGCESRSYPDPDLYRMYVCLAKMGQLPLPDKDFAEGSYPEEEEIRMRFKEMKVALDVFYYNGPAPGTVMMSHQEVAKALEDELWE